MISIGDQNFVFSLLYQFDHKLEKKSRTSIFFFLVDFYTYISEVISEIKNSNDENDEIIFWKIPNLALIVWY